MDELAEYNEIQTRISHNRKAKANLAAFAKKHHYLISTDVIPGIFNSPFNP